MLLTSGASSDLFLPGPQAWGLFWRQYTKCLLYRRSPRTKKSFLCLRHKPTELAHSFYSVLVSVSVFMALSTVFHSLNSAPDNSALSLCSSGLISALLVLSTTYLPKGLPPLSLSLSLSLSLTHTHTHIQKHTDKHTHTSLSTSTKLIALVVIHIFCTAQCFWKFVG